MTGSNTMFNSNEFQQFQLRQKDWQRQVEEARLLKEALQEEREQRKRQPEKKQNTLLTRISVLF